MKKKKSIPNEIRIVVAGRAAVGKSTIMQVITQALAEKGFTVEISALFGDNPLVCNEENMYRIGRIKGKRKTKIVLEERQTFASITGGKDMIYGVKS